MKIRPVGDRKTNMMKVRVAPRNFVKARRIDYKLHPVGLSVHMENHELHRTDFCEIRHLGGFMLICRHVTVLFKKLTKITDTIGEDVRTCISRHD